MFEDLPVKVGIVYEGERIRGPDTFLELGGPKVDYKAELVQLVPKEKIKEDGGVIIIGKDIPEFQKGSRVPFGILVEVTGEKIEKDLESVMERRIHDFLNYVQSFMHLNQRYDIWCRIGKEGKEKGLKFEHLGKALIDLYKAEYSIIDAMQVTFMTDEKIVKEHNDRARDIYEKRDSRIRGMQDADVEEFYGCTLCQSFAPNHVCVISPQRVSLCGSISWLDARAAAKVDPDGPNFPIKKGKLLDEKAGEYDNVNEVMAEVTNGVSERVHMYSMFNFPHTSCGCFEVIGFYVPEVDGIGIVDRSFPDTAVNGMKFSSLATHTGGGEQREGFLGFGLEWMYSDKFFYAEGGWNRIIWMPLTLKEKMKEAIPKEIYDKIPTEKEVTGLDGLRAFLKEKNHPIIEKWAEVTKEDKTGSTKEESDVKEMPPTLTLDTLPLTEETGSGGERITVILKNAKIYADKVIIRKNDNKTVKKKKEES